MNKAAERLYNGIIKENPTLVLLLGMCPTMAVTTKAANGMGMGLTTLAVLALSNLIISLLRKVIPNRVRIPAFIVIIASFVTMMQLLLQAYLPWLYTALGVYIPLIVVNCIILGRAESYAYKNPPIASFFDGVGMGLGFTFSLTIIGALREILGSGTLFDKEILPAGFVPIRIFGLAPGAFFVMALLCAIQNAVKRKIGTKTVETEDLAKGCSMDCTSCADVSCGVRLIETETTPQNQNEKTEEMKVQHSLPAEPVKPEVDQRIDVKELSDRVKLNEEAIREKLKAEIEAETIKEEPAKEEAAKEKEPAKEEAAKEKEPAKEEAVKEEEPAKEEAAKEEEPAKEEAPETTEKAKAGNPNPPQYGNKRKKNKKKKRSGQSGQGNLQNQNRKK